MKIPISRGDAYLSERVALERGERLDLVSLYWKMIDPEFYPPPFEVLEYLARYQLSPPPGRPLDTHRTKSAKHSIAIVVTDKFRALRDDGKSRPEALQWLADDLNAKEIVIEGKPMTYTTNSIEDILIPEQTRPFSTGTFSRD